MKQNYLAGKARRPYSHTPILGSLEEDQDNAASSSSAAQSVCSKCLPVLSMYKDTFQGLTQHGSKLKRCKTVNPHPKLPERAHCRDLVKQNSWIHENLLDGMGNLLFCSRCIYSAFNISQQRLSRQREVKGHQFQQPISEMTKREVEEKRLGEYVVPEEVCEGFLTWWSIDSLTMVNVRVPHERHGLAGKSSNSAKFNGYTHAQSCFMQ